MYIRVSRFILTAILLLGAIAGVPADRSLSTDPQVEPTSMPAGDPWIVDKL
jgi:hypothetical protein